MPIVVAVAFILLSWLLFLARDKTRFIDWYSASARGESALANVRRSRPWFTAEFAAEMAWRRLLVIAGFVWLVLAGVIIAALLRQLSG